MRWWSHISLLLFLSVSGCSEGEEQKRFRGLIEIGPHGPVFTSAEIFDEAEGEYNPWRMSGKEPGFSRGLDSVAEQTKRKGLPSFTAIRAEFRGSEVPVKLNGVGFTREVSVEKWLALTPCETGAGKFRECLRE